MLPVYWGFIGTIGTQVILRIEEYPATLALTPLTCTEVIRSLLVDESCVPTISVEVADRVHSFARRPADDGECFTDPYRRGPLVSVFVLGMFVGTV